MGRAGLANAALRGNAVEAVVHEVHDHCVVSDGGRAALDGAASDVAGGEDPGDEDPGTLVSSSALMRRRRRSVLPVARNVAEPIHPALR